jgi:hypothetical protein
MRREIGHIYISRIFLSVDSGNPPHDSNDGGSNPAEVVEFLRMEKFRDQVLREGL